MREAASWTVAVYMAADNDMSAEALADLGRMKKSGSTGDLNIVVQLDRGGGTKRLFITQGGAWEDDEVADLGVRNTGDPDVLRTFVDWTKKNYPAEHEALVIWNHGTGWDDRNVYGGSPLISASPELQSLKAHSADPLVSARIEHARRALFWKTLRRTVDAVIMGAAYDDSQRDFLDNGELKLALTGVKHDLLGMSACLMSMIEVAWQIRDAADLLIASEENQPKALGWPFEPVFDAARKRPDPEIIGRTIVDAYVASRSAPDQDVTLSLIDLGALEPVISSLDSLVAYLIPKLETDFCAILQVRESMITFGSRQYVDIVAFASALSQALPDATTVCAALTKAVKGAVLHEAHAGPRTGQSNGLSIYFPVNGPSPLYENLDFAVDCKWADFLEIFEKEWRVSAAGCNPV